MVITDTATMIGEINGSSTLSETPSPAIMKANSPICARLNPDLMEVFSGSPDKSTPNEEKWSGVDGRTVGASERQFQRVGR